jgi:dUTP pyrophosphatase
MLQVHVESGSSTIKPNGFGYDVFASENCIILPGKRAAVRTGLKIHSMSPDTYGKVLSVPGISIKHGVEVSSCVIEPGYKDEVKIIMYNHDDTKAFVIKEGYKIAQLVFEKYRPCEIHEVIDLTLSDTNE